MDAQRPCGALLLAGFKGCKPTLCLLGCGGCKGPESFTVPCCTGGGGVLRTGACTLAILRVRACALGATKSYCRGWGLCTNGPRYVISVSGFGGHVLKRHHMMSHVLSGFKTAQLPGPRDPGGQGFGGVLYRMQGFGRPGPVAAGCMWLVRCCCGGVLSAVHCVQAWHVISACYLLLLLFCVHCV